MSPADLRNEITTELGFYAAVTDAMAIIAMNRASDQLRDDTVTKMLLGVTEGLRRLAIKAGELEVGPYLREVAS